MIEIVKWSECFESADTRKRQRLGWFLSPSGSDSRGYRQLMRMGSDGLIALGVFQALCQSMATQNIKTRQSGVFKNTDGSMMEMDDILELSRLTGTSPADYRQIIGRLVSVGWISLHKSLDSQQSATYLPPICQSSPGFVQGEGEGQEEGKDILSEIGRVESYSDIVETLWQIFPPKSRDRSSKKKLSQALKKASPKPTDETLVKFARKWANCHEWTKDGGQFAPGAHIWVNDRKWESEPLVIGNSTKPQTDSVHDMGMSRS